MEPDQPSRAGESVDLVVMALYSYGLQGSDLDSHDLDSHDLQACTHVQTSVARALGTPVGDADAEAVLVAPAHASAVAGCRSPPWQNGTGPPRPLSSKPVSQSVSQVYSLSRCKRL